MVRQCAWCLCLIDAQGKRISSSPLPKLYEASHGICSVCGESCMEQITAQDTRRVKENNESYQGQPSPTDLIFELQQEPGNTTRTPLPRRKS